MTGNGFRSSLYRPGLGGGNYGRSFVSYFSCAYGIIEQKLVYSAYRLAFELAVENGFQSIGFPLVSACIFGCPTASAWQTTLQACGDFLGEGNRIDIVFVVRSDRILEDRMRFRGKMSETR